MPNKPIDLYPYAILHQLNTKTIPRRVLVYNQTGSTMDLAREHLRAASAEELPLLVVANEQTAGRGRLKRPWVAPPGSALLFSLALRPDWLKPVYAMRLVWLAGVALCEGIRAATGLQTMLKWPNDVMVDYVLPDEPTQTPTPHKVAGILLETGSSSHAVSWAVLGCGINVCASPPTHDTRYPAIHLAAAAQNPISRLSLLRSVLQRMDVWYSRMMTMPQEDTTQDRLFVAWRSLLITPGKPVQIATADGSMLVGYAEDVEPSGALRVRCADGSLHRVSSGDVGV